MVIVQTVARYMPVQLELIGTGTFGTVYKAFDMLAKQYVAIKLIGAR